MAFWVYILECADGSFYTGHTENLEYRLAEHRAADVRSYTSSRLPIKLVYSQYFVSRYEALVCERQIKGWTRKKKMALIKEDWPEISRLAKKDFEKIDKG